MIARDKIAQMKQRIAGADGIPPLLRAFEELQRLELEQEGSEDLDDLRLEALDGLARLTQESPGEADPIILGQLLPLCLRAKEEWRVPRVARRYDEMLSRWLDRFPNPHRYALRASVLKALAVAVSGPATERACRLIGVLGYRDDHLCDRLLDLSRSDVDAVCDVALYVLTVLGMSPSRHTALIDLWRGRVFAVLWNLELIGAARQLASAEILDPVFDCWLTREKLGSTDVSHSILPRVAMAVPAAVAERSPEDAELQDGVWDRLRALEPEASALFLERVLRSTQVAYPCDSAGVVRYFLSKLDGKEHTRNLAYFRLEECDRPRQLLGWNDDPGQNVVNVVLQDARISTGMSGSFMTQDLRRKLQAWETLLSLAKEEALASVDAAVASERNGHAVGSILNILACFRLNPVPPRVRALIAGEFEGIADDDSERVSSHVGAIAVAHASGSQSAFEALLDFNVIRGGGVLISLLDALTDTAASLIQGGDTRVADSLWRAAAAGEPEHRRAAAAATLGRLLRRNVLQPLPVNLIVEIIEDARLDSYGRREVLEGLGHQATDDISPRLVQSLWHAASAAPKLDGWNGEAQGADFRPVALASLARLGLLVADPDALRQVLKLRLEGTTWRHDHPPAFPGAPVVVGILYAQQPDTFAAAAADVLRAGDWTAVVQIASFLRSGPRPVPEAVVTAILERIRDIGPESGEPDLVPLLADLAPVRIVSESWSGILDWPPQVRAALAETLAHSHSSDDIDRRVSLLLVLMGDGQYGVRRAAFRAMAQIVAVYSPITKSGKLAQLSDFPFDSLAAWTPASSSNRMCARGESTWIGWSISS